MEESVVSLDGENGIEIIIVYLVLVVLPDTLIKLDFELVQENTSAFADSCGLM